MDESSGGFSVAGEWTTHAAREVVASASGKLWSFVDARELRNVLGQLIASELLRMSLADLLNQILIDLEKESHVARAARKEGGDDRAWRQAFELAGP